MPWVKLTDDWYDDPQVVAAGDDGGWLWVVALSWCARNLTDGVIPRRQVSRLTTLDEPLAIAARLVDPHGLWADHPEGFVVVNYHRFQPTRAEVLAKREAEADRKRRSRGTDRDQRPADVRADSERSPSPPDPGPEPVNPSSSSVLPVDSVLDEVAEMRTKAAKEAGRITSSPVRYRDRIRKNLPAEIGDRVIELLDIYDEPPHRIAQLVEGSLNGRNANRKPVAS